MEFFKISVLILVLIGVTHGSPANKPSFRKGTPWDASVEEMRSSCADDDPIACLKFKAISFLDSIFQQDKFQVSEDIEVNRNSYRSNEIYSRNGKSLEENAEEYVKSHDFTFKFPIVDSTVTVGGANLDKDEMDFKFRFNTGTGVEEARKSKLKKILFPILTFVLLKAITLVPLALGILGLKAWNALQLSFFSFVISVGLAIFQLCKKIAADNAHPQIAAHIPWEAAARSFNIENDAHSEAQELAYSAYAW